MDTQDKVLTELATHLGRTFYDTLNEGAEPREMVAFVAQNKHVVTAMLPPVTPETKENLRDWVVLLAAAVGSDGVVWVADTWMRRYMKDDLPVEVRPSEDPRSVEAVMISVGKMEPEGPGMKSMCMVYHREDDGTLTWEEPDGTTGREMRNAPIKGDIPGYLATMVTPEVEPAPPGALERVAECMKAEGFIFLWHEGDGIRIDPPLD